MLRALLGLVLASIMMIPAAWAQSSYKIQPGDVLQMEVLEESELQKNMEKSTLR